MNSTIGRAIRARMRTAVLAFCCVSLGASTPEPAFRVLAFFTASYVSNTWRPTSAILRVEDRTHPAAAHLPQTFESSPNEWYRWERDLRRNPDIDILVAIDPASFPLGTGPKPEEIWREGYYPVVWTNKKYRMLYLNIGHNDIDYEHRYGPTNSTLSHTLNNSVQDRLIIDGLLWLGRRKPASR